MKQNCIVFLGAGATKLWGGKITHELTEDIINNFPLKDSRNKNFLKSLLKLTGKKAITNFEVILSYLEYLFEFYHWKSQVVYDHSHNNNEWTDLFKTSTISKLIPKYIQSSNGDWKYVNNATLEPFLFASALPEKSNRNFIYLCYFKILDIINKHVQEYSSSLLYDDRIREMLAYFKKKNTLRIYSTNYDTILTRCDNSLFNGYKGQIFKADSVYDYKGHCFYNLHGNIFLHLRKGDRIDIFKYDNTETFIMNHQQLIMHNVSKQTFIKSPIISGQQKLLRTMDEPFFSYLKSLENDISTSSKIIFIGTSFEDNHIFKSVRYHLKNQLSLQKKDINIQIITSDGDLNGQLKKILSQLLDYDDWNILFDSNYPLKILKSTDQTIISHIGRLKVQVYNCGIEKYLLEKKYEDPL